MIWLQTSLGCLAIPGLFPLPHHTCLSSSLLIFLFTNTPPDSSWHLLTPPIWLYQGLSPPLPPPCMPTYSGIQVSLEKKQNKPDNINSSRLAYMSIWMFNLQYQIFESSSWLQTFCGFDFVVLSAANSYVIIWNCIWTSMKNDNNN